MNKTYIESMRELFKDSFLYSIRYSETSAILEDLGFLDHSWHNDCCPSFGMSDQQGINQVMLWFPNSEKNNLDNEQWNTFSLMLLDSENYNGIQIFLTDDFDEVLSCLKSNLALFNNHINTETTQ